MHDSRLESLDLRSKVAMAAIRLSSVIPYFSCICGLMPSFAFNPPVSRRAMLSAKSWLAPALSMVW